MEKRKSSIATEVSNRQQKEVSFLDITGNPMLVHDSSHAPLSAKHLTHQHSGLASCEDTGAPEGAPSPAERHEMAADEET
jgi:hypothetical protein